MRYRTRLLGCLFVGALIAACGSSVGPSNDKIQLDLEDFIKEQTRGIVSVSILEMKRKALSEDRVRVEMRVSYKANQEDLRKASSAIQIMNATPFGAMGAFDLGRAVDKARQLDGKSEEFTWVYRLEGNGLWKIAQSYNGHDRH